MFKKWIDLGLKKGLEALEIYGVTNKSLALQVYQGKLDKHVQSSVTAITIKGIYQGNAATVSFEKITDQTADYMLDKLIDATKAITVNEPALIYEGSKEYPKVESNTFDFSNIDFNQKFNLLKDLESKIAENKLCKQVQMTVYQEVAVETVLVNSKGLNLSRNYTYAYAGAVGVFQKDADIKTAYDVKAVKNFSEFDVDAIAKKIVDKGVAAVGGESVKSAIYPTVFSKEMFANIIQVFTTIFSGETAFRNLSPLKDKVGEQIAVSEFTLIDDPLNKEAFFQNAFDDEGVACATRSIIEGGVFKGFMHNLKTATIFNVEPTGNGFGGGISPSNLYLKPGIKTFDETIATIKDGIYITDLAGLHSGVKPVSGDFSLQAGGFKIENGKITTPVKMIVVSGNLFKMLNNIQTIGADLEFGISGFGSPTVYVGDLSIAGEK